MCLSFFFHRSIMRRSVSPLLLLLLVSVSLSAQDSSYARRIIAGLSDVSVWGRGYSYRGDSIAAEFIRSEFQKLGVEPLGDNYFQNYELDVYGFEGDCELSINGNQLVPYEEFRVVPAYSAKRRMEAAWSKTFNVVSLIRILMASMLFQTGCSKIPP